MTEQDMLELLEAHKSYMWLQKQLEKLTGGNIFDNEHIEGLNNLYDVILRNSRFADPMDEDGFMDVMYSKKSVKEKYKLLRKDK